MQNLRTLPRVLSLSLCAVVCFFHTARSQSNDGMKKMDMGGQKKDTAATTSAAMAAPAQAGMDMANSSMDMVHPFFTHMGLPDPAGHYAFRMSGSAASVEGNGVGDFGFHLETGLAKRLGLHIRNDRFITNAHTELSLQYAILESADGMTGLSPFVELEIPTRSDEPHTYGLVGFSTMWTSSIIELNQSLEYSPAEKGVEGSVSIVASLGSGFFPVAEFLLATGVGTVAQNSVIAGLKYRINNAIALGLAYQVPVTDARDYTHQVRLQTDVEW